MYKRQGVCSAAFAEGVNVYQFISVYYWFLAINSSDVGIPIIDVTVFEMDKYDLYGAYKLSICANSETNEVVSIRVSSEDDERVALTACLGILMPFQSLSIDMALGTWEENMRDIGRNFDKVMDGGSFEQEGYVFHLADNGDFCIMEKSYYDR